VEEMTEMPAKTNRDISWATQTCMLGYDLVGKTQTHTGGFKEWPIVQCAVADEALEIWSSEAPDENQ